MTQYDNIAKEYTELAKSDPIKIFLQYSEAMRLLGDLSGKSVLDVGCGPGLFTREIAKKAMSVVGYDISQKLIDIANNGSMANVRYLHASSHNIEQELASHGKFDKAVSTMVLMYAKDAAELRKFFQSTYNLLKNNGEFISVIYNPSHIITGEEKYNRKFHMNNSNIVVTFLNQQNHSETTAEFRNFSKKDYEFAASNLGFELEWVDLRPSFGVISEQKEHYWDDFLKNPAYIGFIARKRDTNIIK